MTVLDQSRRTWFPVQRLLSYSLLFLTAIVAITALAACTDSSPGDALVQREHPVTAESDYVALEVMSPAPHIFRPHQDETTMFFVRATQIDDVPSAPGRTWGWELLLYVFDPATEEVVYKTNLYKTFDDTCGSCNDWVWTFTWDGKDQSLDLVPPGRYPFLVELVLVSHDDSVMQVRDTVSVASEDTDDDVLDA